MSDTRYISQITLPDGNTYNLKDLYAWEMIEDLMAGALSFVKATDAGSTPEGVKWGDPEITGTLVASASTKGKIYLVPQKNGAGKDLHAEYVTINTGTEANPSYAWEKLGDTEINFDNLGQLAYKNSVTLNKQSDSVLGASTTFTNAASAVTFSGDSSDTFVKSYPGTSSKLETASIKGVGEDITFDAVSSATNVTTTYVAFGTDTKASKVVTEEKTATNTVLGTATTASKATAGTAVSLAKAASSATNVSYIGNASTSNVLTTATVTGEVLSFGDASVKQGQVTGTNGSESIIPYTFADVSVPVITSNTSVTTNSVKTNTDVTVPVISSHEDRTASAVTTASKTAATSAASATTVATGSLKANDAVGAEIMTGLGTAVTGSAVTGLGTATAAAQTITVGTNDPVTALTDSTDVTVG